MPVTADENPNQGNTSLAGVAAKGPFVITPSDTDELPIVVRAIRADGDGVITVKPKYPITGQESVAHPVKDGEIIVGYFKQVMATGTTGQTTPIGYV
jgi:hypothetical protein